ncbi:Auxin-responsive protein [Nymphaea thermarum]|nr:Auxin-responsive protein [Nymphaea thermarum]
MVTSSSNRNINGIRQAILLKQMLKKWRLLSLDHHHKSHSSTAADPSTPTCTFSPKFRRPSSFSSGIHSHHHGDDEEGKPASNRRTPAGYVAFYVGLERRRFVIPTRYLNLPIFSALLQQSEEEFGYQSTGALALPCDVSLFTALLAGLRKNEKAFARLPLDDFLKLVSLSPSSDGDEPSPGDDVFCGGASCLASSSHKKGLFHAPLLQKARA